MKTIPLAFALVALAAAVCADEEISKARYSITNADGSVRWELRFSKGPAGEFFGISRPHGFSASAKKQDARLLVEVLSSFQSMAARAKSKGITSGPDRPIEAKNKLAQGYHLGFFDGAPVLCGGGQISLDEVAELKTILGKLDSYERADRKAATW